MPERQPPPEIPKLKRPHYVHDYVDLDLCATSEFCT